MAAVDPPSERLVTETVAGQAQLRASHVATGAALAARASITALVQRQVERRAQARNTARSDSRRALLEIGITGLLALLAVMALVSALIARMRRPLSDLVAAARRLESGDLGARVRAEGPTELRTLATAFNAMADNLAAAASRLEAERRRLDQTIQSLGDALLVVDADGTVAAANPRAGELLPELPAGARLTEAASLPPLERALESEVTLEREGRTLAATAARVTDPERGGVVWTIRDVTERARLERLKSEFVATASHELRSPMTSIKGFVELLATSSGLSARQREFVEIILASTNRLVDLVNDLLDVARIEAGEAELHRRSIDLTEVVEEVTTLMRPRVDEKRQRLTVEVEPGLPRALVDPSRMRQVLINLLTNAHLYTPPDGRLRVALHSKDGMVALAVADDGPGMSHEQLERIFERFYRHAGNNDSVPGTGLGLAIVKSLVDMQDGTIEVESELDVGTTFTVLVPQAPARAAFTAAQAALDGRRVLVVDDERSVARLIVAQLAAFGVECVTAANGGEAIERLRREHFDALTLDILMPGMSGFDVLRELRSDPALRDLPVVVVSVFSGGEALAGEWVVSKPIDADELADAIGSAVLSRRVRVLAVTRRSVRAQVEATLEEVGIEYRFASTIAEVKDLCASHPFEAALIDAGLRSPAAAIEALDLRGQRLHRNVIVFALDLDAPGLARLDAETVSIEAAGMALADLMQTRVES
jgi:signal transduction histidine kinase/FixJ family two-component response regulator